MHLQLPQSKKDFPKLRMEFRGYAWDTAPRFQVDLAATGPPAVLRYVVLGKFVLPLHNEGIRGIAPLARLSFGLSGGCLGLRHHKSVAPRKFAPRVSATTAPRQRATARVIRKPRGSVRRDPRAATEAPGGAAPSAEASGVQPKTERTHGKRAG